jgi:hypothetical protein
MGGTMTGFSIRACACIVLVAALVDCGGRTKEEEMKAAQQDLVDEAMALQRCYGENGYSDDQCASRCKSYDSHLAGFRTKYGQ